VQADPPRLALATERLDKREHRDSALSRELLDAPIGIEEIADVERLRITPTHLAIGMDLPPIGEHEQMERRAVLLDLVAHLRDEALCDVPSLAPHLIGRRRVDEVLGRFLGLVLRSTCAQRAQLLDELHEMEARGEPALEVWRQRAVCVRPHAALRRKESSSSNAPSLTTKYGLSSVFSSARELFRMSFPVRNDRTTRSGW